MVTINPKIVSACNADDVSVLQSLFDMDEPIVVSDEECGDSSSDCGYCYACSPPDPLESAVVENRVDVVRALLANPKYPGGWENGTRVVTIAARHADSTMLDLFLSDPRYFPADKPESLVRMMQIANINGPQDVWKLTAHESVLALPESMVRREGCVNDQNFYNQWMKFRRLRDDVLRGDDSFTWDDIPEEWRVSSMDLEGSYDDLNKVLSVVVETDCYLWQGECCHFVTTTLKNGHHWRSKVRGFSVLDRYPDALSAELRDHLGTGK